MDFDASASKIGIKWGIVLGLCHIVFILVKHFVSLQGISGSMESDPVFIPTMLLYPILFACFFLGIRAFRSANSGLLDLGEGLRVALAIGIVSALISAFFIFTYMHFIIPDTLVTMKQELIQNREAINISQKENDLFIDMMSTFLSPISWHLLQYS